MLSKPALRIAGRRTLFFKRVVSTTAVLAFFDRKKPEKLLLIYFLANR